MFGKLVLLLIVIVLLVALFRALDKGPIKLTLDEDNSVIEDDDEESK